MKNYILILLVLFAFGACKNKQQEEQLANLKNQDSLLGNKTQQQDSTITAYIKAFNDIQDNLDSIKRRQKIITLSSSSGETPDKKTMIISDMRDIEAIMMKNRRDLAYMQKKLKSEGAKNADLEKMIAHLTEELSDKDAEIADLQTQLTKVISDYKDIQRKFNDSMQVIAEKNREISAQNVVYYAFGTTKELKNKGVIMKAGGVLGVGGTEELKPNTNTQYFTPADMNSITVIPLFSKFEKLVTIHPAGSYAIHGNNKVDSLVITDKKSFWSESKYLVIIVKQK